MSRLLSNAVPGQSPPTRQLLVDKHKMCPIALGNVTLTRASGTPDLSARKVGFSATTILSCCQQANALVGPANLKDRPIPRVFVLLSSRQRIEKLTAVHAVLECLASVDENYGYLVVVLLPHLGVEVDIHLAPLEVSLAQYLRQRLLDDVAEMTSLARIDHHVVHRAIVDGVLKLSGGL